MVDDLNGSKEYMDYRRTLDLNTAEARVEYTSAGVRYEREYFVSNPGNIFAMRLTADQKGKLNRKVYMDTPQKAVNIFAEGNTITMTGHPADHVEAEHLEFAQQIRVIPEEGKEG